MIYGSKFTHLKKNHTLMRHKKRKTGLMIMIRPPT